TFMQDMVGIGGNKGTSAGLSVIPGWSKGPDPESRDSGLDAAHRTGMTPMASFREPVRPPLLHTPLERRPRMHPRQPRREVGIGPKLLEHFCDLADEAHLDVRPRQRRPNEEFTALQRALDITEMVGDLAVDPRMQGGPGFLQARHEGVRHH